MVGGGGSVRGTAGHTDRPALSVLESLPVTVPSTVDSQSTNSLLQSALSDISP